MESKEPGLVVIPLIRSQVKNSDRKASKTLEALRRNPFNQVTSKKYEYYKDENGTVYSRNPFNQVTSKKFNTRQEIVVVQELS